MATNKSLYFLHIPKTGGLALRNLQSVMKNNGILQYPNSSNRGRYNLLDFSYYRLVAWHFGITPMTYPNFDTAVLLREPLDRVISNFSWLLMINAFEFITSYSGLTVEEKLRHYLFTDEYYSEHKNVQTKFLTLKISNENLNKYYKEQFGYPHDFEEWDKKHLTKTDVDPVRLYEYLFVKRTSSWYLDTGEVSVDNAKLNLDKCAIIGLTEDYDVFMDKIFIWLEENLDIDAREEFNSNLSAHLENKQTPYYNYSQFTDIDGTAYTTQSLKALLTQEEVDRIYADNSMDVELYEYAKAKLQ